MILVQWSSSRANSKFGRHHTSRKGLCPLLQPLSGFPSECRPPTERAPKGEHTLTGQYQYSRTPSNMPQKESLNCPQLTPCQAYCAMQWVNLKWRHVWACWLPAYQLWLNIFNHLFGMLSFPWSERDVPCTWGPRFSEALN